MSFPTFRQIQPGILTPDAAAEINRALRMIEQLARPAATYPLQISYDSGLSLSYGGILPEVCRVTDATAGGYLGSGYYPALREGYAAGIVTGGRVGSEPADGGWLDADPVWLIGVNEEALQSKRYLAYQESWYTAADGVSRPVFVCADPFGDLTETIQPGTTWNVGGSLTVTGGGTVVYDTNITNVYLGDTIYEGPTYNVNPPAVNVVSLVCVQTMDSSSTGSGSPQNITGSPANITDGPALTVTVPTTPAAPIEFPAPIGTPIAPLTPIPTTIYGDMLLRGTVAGGEYHATLLYSTNGGSTWTTLSPPLVYVSPATGGGGTISKNFPLSLTPGKTYQFKWQIAQTFGTPTGTVDPAGTGLAVQGGPVVTVERTRLYLPGASAGSLGCTQNPDYCCAGAVVSASGSGGSGSSGGSGGGSGCLVVACVPNQIGQALTGTVGGAVAGTVALSFLVATTVSVEWSGVIAGGPCAGTTVELLCEGGSWGFQSIGGPCALGGPLAYDAGSGTLTGTIHYTILSGGSGSGTAAVTVAGQGGGALCQGSGGTTSGAVQVQCCPGTALPLTLFIKLTLLRVVAGKRTFSQSYTVPVTNPGGANCWTGTLTPPSPCDNLTIYLYLCCCGEGGLYQWWLGGSCKIPDGAGWDMTQPACDWFINSEPADSVSCSPLSLSFAGIVPVSTFCRPCSDGSLSQDIAFENATVTT